MRKLIVLAMAVFMVTAFAGVAKAEGDFEMSGHVNTGFGWQYNAKKAVSAGGGFFVQEGMIPIDIAGAGAATSLSNNNTFLFYVGDVELDIMKSFGENIALRADLDFLRGGSNGFTNIFTGATGIEQAYATVNIPVGAGLEFLVGRFNAPLGLEAVDNNDNDLPFHSPIFNFLRPQNLTGAKFYYPFSDLVDLHFWLANNLRDVAELAGADGDLPALGLRVGFKWGSEGQESTVGLSGALSPEVKQTGNKWDDWTWFGDVDANIWFTDVFAVGLEGIFRRDGALKGANDNYYYGGLLNLHYLFSDEWDGTLRYSYVHDISGSAFNAAGGATGAATLNALAGATQYHRFAGSAMGYDAQFHQGDLGLNYHITDGAKIMASYRFDFIMPDKAGAASNNLTKTGMAHSVAANFAYEF